MKIVNETVNIIENALKFRGLIKIINESISILENTISKLSAIIIAPIQAFIRRFIKDTEARQFLFDNEARKFILDTEVREFHV